MKRTFEAFEKYTNKLIVVHALDGFLNEYNRWTLREGKEEKGLMEWIKVNTWSKNKKLKNEKIEIFEVRMCDAFSIFKPIRRWTMDTIDEWE